jgi:hypothetical protein
MDLMVFHVLCKMIFRDLYVVSISTCFHCFCNIVVICFAFTFAFTLQFDFIQGASFCAVLISLGVTSSAWFNNFF